MSSTFYLSLSNQHINDKEGSFAFFRSREFDDYLLFEHLDNPDIEDKYSKSQYLISPNIGDIIFFPSHLLHSVYPHTSDEDRISIAFNSMRV
jgi:hypothetical protein